MRNDPHPPGTLRRPAPGDFGWIVERHGALYSREFGLDNRFEGVTASVIADFIRSFDPDRERCWIAEQEGVRVGSVLLARDAQEVAAARLRLLLVDPVARGHGIGRRLVRACTRFARQAGYEKVTLWTADVLTAARRIYAEEGFRLVRTEPFSGFGPEMIGESWEMSLRAARDTSQTQEGN